MIHLCTAHRKEKTDMQIIIYHARQCHSRLLFVCWFCYDSTHWSYQAQRFFRLFNDDWSCGVNQSTIVLPSAIMAASWYIHGILQQKAFSCDVLSCCPWLLVCVCVCVIHICVFFERYRQVWSWGKLITLGFLAHWFAMPGFGCVFLRR